RGSRGGAGCTRPAGRDTDLKTHVAPPSSWLVFPIGPVVIDDGAPAVGILDQSIAGIAQQDVEGLVGLLLLVPLDHDGNGSARFARGERQRPGGGNIVVVGDCRRAVVGGELDRYWLVVGGGERHGEDHRLGAAVTFFDAHAVDADPRLVVKDVHVAGVVDD